MHARVRAVVVAVMALLTGGVVAAVPAGAITGGTADPDGVHGNVGMIVSYVDGARYRCTATLVRPTVLLTAAHCTDGTDGKTIVSFAPEIDEAAPADIPTAQDPIAGYTGAPRGWFSGTASTHPGYSGFTDLNNWNDVGVVVLDRAVRGVSPAALAPRGYLDRFTPDVLNSTLFRAVGYGTEVRQADDGAQNPTPMSYPIIRRYADMPGQQITAQILQVNGNIHDDRGSGGTCFGDSGGPGLHQGMIVTVTSYGYTANCRYIDGLQRVDIPVVQEWLAGFGVVPAA